MEEKRIVIILLAFGAIAFLCWLLSLHRNSNKGYPVTGLQETNEKKIKKAVDTLKPMTKLDPVKRCEVYKQFGCSHVDGFLCQVETCNIEVNGVIPIKKEELCQNSNLK